MFRRQIILIVSTPVSKLYILKPFGKLSITIIIMKTASVVNSITFLALQAWNCTVLIDLFWPIEFDFVKIIWNQRNKKKKKENHCLFQEAEVWAFDV